MNSIKTKHRNTLLPIQLKGHAISRKSSTCSDESSNSFLMEIDYNHDIDEKIRDEIDMRYKRSPTNAHYKFPRGDAKAGRNLPIVHYKTPREKTLDYVKRKDSLINNIQKITNVTEFLNKSLKSQSPTRFKKQSPRGRFGKTPSPLSTLIFNLAPLVSATPSNLSTKHTIRHSQFPKLTNQSYRGSKSPTPVLFSFSQEMKRL